MGNQLTVEKIIENLDEFDPDLSLYQLVNRNNFQQNRSINKWQHKFTSQRLVQKKYLVRTWLQFYELLESFSFRYNNNHIVASKYLIVQNSQSIRKLSNQKAFPDTSVSIFYQDSLTNLSHFKQIPQQDGAYFLLQSLKGFGSLVRKLKFPFVVKEQMFHITANKQLKIWVDQNISDLSVINGLKPLPSQSYMMHKILETIKTNIFFTTQSQKTIPIQNIYMPPIIIQELLKKKHQNFQQVIQLAQRYLDHYQLKIGSYMSCLKDLTNEQLIGFMDKNYMDQNYNRNVYEPRYASSTDQNSRVIVNNSSQVSVKPFTPVNNFSNQSSFINLQRNYSMGNLTNYQQNQSRIMDSKIHTTAKNSRSKSNKRSGLSLTKTQDKNHHSAILIKQHRPSTSFINKSHQSPLKILPKQPKLPPRSSSAKKINFTITQQKENLTPFNQNSKKLQLSNHHSRGISITKKQQSQQKSPMLKLNPQSPFSKATNHYNTQLSGTINCSTVSVGTLPTPKYRNDSKAKTTFNPNNMSINFSTHKPSEIFVPNQSLTRFQKENITYNNSASLNASVNQNYEMPKIYVHSPKAQGKILRFDSMSTQQESGQKSITFQQKVVKHVRFSNNISSDHIKEQPSSQVFYYPKNPLKQNKDFQTPLNTNKKTNQFNSYIEQNNQIFTHPRLYEYITNNKSNQNIKNQSSSLINRTQEKKPTYIDYLSNVQISQSLDYNTADKLFSLGQKKQKKQLKEPVKKPEIISPINNNFSLNDFPTIEQIEQPLHSNDEGRQKQENTSFLPVQLNLMSNNNLGSMNHLSTVRRGQQQSMVVQYKKFYDDTNRSVNSPNKHYFSPLKKKPAIQLYNPSNFQSNMAKKYNTAQNWQAQPPKPAKPQTVFNNNLFPIQQNPRQPMIIVSKPNQQTRRNSPSPVSKIIYNGTKQPAINPLILQDMQRIRQNKIY